MTKEETTFEMQQEIERLRKRVEELEGEGLKQRYGLVWEDSPEKLDDPNIVPLLSIDTDEYLKQFIKGNGLNKDILIDEEKPMNYLIEGDNYHSLKALERTHTGKIDVIYIDPPYNTGNEFVYNDKIVDKEDGYRHSKWLSFMSKRLELARRLMTDDGVIFVSIDDNEQAQLKLLMDSIFGEQNFISNFIWLFSKNSVKNGEIQFISSNLGQFKNVREYVLMYAKNKDKVKLGRIKQSREEYIDSRITNKGNTRSKLILKKGIRCEAESLNIKTNTVGGDAEKIKIIEGGIQVKNNKLQNDVEIEGEFRNPNIVRSLMEGKEVYDNRGQKFHEVFLTKTGVPYTRKEKKGETFPNVLSGYGGSSADYNRLIEIFGENRFDYPKPIGIIKDLMRIGGVGQKPDAIILDFFAGSGTTGHAVLELNQEDGGNRQFILCTNNEVSEEKVRNYFHEKGLIPKPNKTEYRKFKKENPEQVLDFMKSDEYQELGIARSVTHERLRRVIEGYTTPKGKDVAGIPANLMYLTTAEYTKEDVRRAREEGRFVDTTEMYAGIYYLKYPRTTHTIMFVTDDLSFNNFKGIDTLPTDNVVIVLSGLDYPHEVESIIRKEVKTKNLIFEYLKY